MISGFLLGVIATSSFIAGTFFLKFWRRTHDGLFLAFGWAFFIEAFNRITLLFTAHPSEASPVFYLVRLFAFLLILAGILRKNYGKN
ncbi:MAG TPA: DUF5985 family protein [Terracidiphilus sp.]|nr:DUF5985 family protein [Terracidiphilus sp.]